MNFDNFYADMGEAPEGRLIERKNNSGDYCPENCCWATLEEQANNKRNNRVVMMDGITDTIARHARRVSLPYKTVWNWFSGVTKKQLG